MLNSTQLAKHISKDLDAKQIQQVSIDLKIKSIETLAFSGAVLKDKTILPRFDTIQSSYNSDYDAVGWLLQPGYYSLTFEEDVQIPNNAGMIIIQRSSMLRNGVTITSSLYDPNFQTDNIGAFATVNNPVFVEQGARIACLYGFECEAVSEDLLYQGQFQNK